MKNAKPCLILFLESDLESDITKQHETSKQIIKKDNKKKEKWNNASEFQPYTSNTAHFLVPSTNLSDVFTHASHGVDLQSWSEWTDYTLYGTGLHFNF